MNRNKIGQFAKRSIQGIAFIIVLFGAIVLVAYGAIYHTSATETIVNASSTPSTMDTRYDEFYSKELDGYKHSQKFLDERKAALDKAQADIMKSFDKIAELRMQSAFLSKLEQK